MGADGGGLLRFHTAAMLAVAAVLLCRLCNGLVMIADHFAECDVAIRYQVDWVLPAQQYGALHEAKNA